jgi:hypothetical protein
MRKHLGIAVILGLIVATNTAAQSADGQRYAVAGGPLLHAATKAGVSWGAYAAMRQLGVARLPATLVASVGVIAAAKGIELAKGHRLGPWDTVHDVAWHGMGVGLGRQRWWVVAGLVVGAVALRCYASPQWGCSR